MKKDKVKHHKHLEKIGVDLYEIQENLLKDSNDKKTKKEERNLLKKQRSTVMTIENCGILLLLLKCFCMKD